MCATHRLTFRSFFPPSRARRQEDALLREQIKKAGGPGNWTAIAEALKGRSSKSCRLRCVVFRASCCARSAGARGRGVVRGAWHRSTQPIDGSAVGPVNAPRDRNASKTPAVPRRLTSTPLASFRAANRTPQQPPISFRGACHCRWCNQLNPSVKRGPFTEEEDKAILAAHDFYGNKWAIISRSIPGR